jgi:AIG2-like family
MTSGLYFAYGSNMDPTQMETRCPDARARGQASLADWEVHIGIRRVATIVKAPGSVTWGVLWALSPSDEQSLDHYEGVATGRYRREILTVQHLGNAHPALVYIEGFVDDGVPRPEYLQRIVDGARAFDLPEEYCAQLARLGR